MTDFRMPSSPLDAVAIAPAELVGRLGAFPTVTVPLYQGRPVDIAWLYNYLTEPAGYFGLIMPSADALGAAVAQFAAQSWRSALVAATVTITGGGKCTVTGTSSAIYAHDPARIGWYDPAWTAPSASDAHWLRMAARTTSLGTVDLLLRHLAEQGCVDGVLPGSELSPPVAGALVLDTGGALIGLDNPEPVSILTQLQGCGVMRPFASRTSVPAADVRRAWWISPQYRTQPVVQLGDQTVPVDPAYPSFLEQP
ncbi:hypothetical protein FZI85_02880 [Mycobacterium sp. CBMA293]|uniref:hypothetical protein n=2 Tax=Mycolicibacterium TaxID=1866885 RepID=UPI0012DD044A|nr:MULTISPECIES: hypothetical protein [unclassified Mycolicibacterium]MUL48075.1 hypothetical protein [Mycolicibacterium sp. CBMA 360]MUL58253.1 hypothetical protein [Mycolicibacterium sp. CBMA 335]MUL73711.1 hypothetical protein [Mycolicibacterium sp. CBMA 311]MUL93136.1 hypothetical protein [Mycolicibacterium sp. CBMA 230]MUM09979.1 hypothetical protein [Mycolicibacterium sp. CBMA 293]